MTTGLVWDERYAWHNAGWLAPGPWAEPWPSPDTPETKRRIWSLLEASGLAARLTRIPARPATDDELLRYHTRAYLDRIGRVCAGGGGDIGENTWIGPNGLEIARLAVGGCLPAVDAVLRGEVANAYALVRPAGHHAEAETARGYCILANTALAALHARQAHGLARIAVVDWDVHHGNGTQHAFYADPSVLTISLHQDGYYPPDTGTSEEIGEGAGRGYNLNVPLPAGSGHGAYLAAFERVVLPALRAFRPELILIASGFDPSVRDPMGRMLCTSETFREMASVVRAAAEELCAGRLVACHEGGYAPSYVPFCGLAVLEALSGIRTEVVDPQAARFGAMADQRLKPHEAAVIDRAAQQVALIG